MRSLNADAQLHAALERDEFVVHYQPQFAVGADSLVGVEALVRWEHPRLGLLAPQRFLPVAEQSGLIVQLGRRVLELVCEQSSLWAASGWTAPRIAVNVSAAQLRSGLLNAIASTLERNRLGGSALALDIAEPVLRGDLPALRRALDPLAALGLRLAIDDFGTGECPPGALQALPLHELKLERSLIDAMPGNVRTADLVRELITMAHGTGLEVGAKGVQRAEQLAALAALGCDAYQGYYGCAPVPAEELTARFAGTAGAG